MTVDDKIKDEKLRYNINREAAKILSLQPSKIDKYEHLPGKKILSSNQSRIKERAKCTYSPLRKSFQKQTS